MLSIAAFLQLKHIRNANIADLVISKHNDREYALFNVGHGTAFKIKVSDRKDFENSVYAFRPIPSGEYSLLSFAGEPERICVKCSSAKGKNFSFKWDVNEIGSHGQI